MAIKLERGCGGEGGWALVFCGFPYIPTIEWISTYETKLTKNQLYTLLGRPVRESVAAVRREAGGQEEDAYIQVQPQPNLQSGPRKPQTDHIFSPRSLPSLVLYVHRVWTLGEPSKKFLVKRTCPIRKCKIFWREKKIIFVYMKKNNNIFVQYVR